VKKGCLIVEKKLRIKCAAIVRSDGVVVEGRTHAGCVRILKSISILFLRIL